MTEEEIKVFEEFKEFLQDWLDGNISSGDAVDYLGDYAERLGIKESE